MQIENTIQSKSSAVFFPIIKQIGVSLTTLLVALAVILISWGAYTAPAEAAPVKWHPGHYVQFLSGGKDSDWYMQQIYAELKSTPALRGVVIRYSWDELEKSKGVYDFSSIDHHLAQLAKRNKRLIIFLEFKSFSADEIRVPKYLRTPEYDGGVWAFAASGTNVIKGYNIKLWNPKVRDRLAALVKALGNRYNAKPNFEGIGFQETAMGDGIKPLTDAQVNGYYNNLLNINQVARNSFPNTMTFQYTNFPRSILSTFIGKLKSMGAALGSPDIFLQEPSLFYKGTPQGIYNYYPKNSGIMPLVVQIEKSNYLDTKHSGTGYKPTIGELLEFGRDTLKVNYIFWTRIPGIHNKVLETLNMNAQNRSPSGGLKAACPSVYDSCTN